MGLSERPVCGIVLTCPLTLPAGTLLNRLLDLPLFLRIPVCAVALSAIIIVCASKTFPAAPMLVIFAWVIAAIAFAGALLIAYFVVVAGWNTWSFDHDTTEAQWLCLDGESSGMHGSHHEGDSHLNTSD
jgi:hypothetical protein